MSEVSRHNAANDLWLVVDGKVYDVTDFVDEHPGGVDAILKKPGMDNTEGFHGAQVSTQHRSAQLSTAQHCTAEMSEARESTYSCFQSIHFTPLTVPTICLSVCLCV